MAKFVIETVQLIKRKYYVEVNDPSWAHDGIVMQELDEFAQEFLSEDIFSTREVEDWPHAEQYDSVNGATMHFDYENEKWVSQVRWDLDK